MAAVRIRPIRLLRGVFQALARPPIRRSGPPSGQCYRAKKPSPILTEQDRIERHRFYGRAAWARCRKLKLRRNPLCECCLREEGKTIPAAHVQHKKDLALRPDLAYDLDNLESLCHPCHSRETLKRLKEDRRNGQEARTTT